MLLLAFLAGCASPVTVTLASDGRSGLSGGAGRTLLVVTPFADERATPGCGVQSGNFGDGPGITCDRAPAPFLTSALVEELKRVGFAVRQAHRPDPAAGATIIRGALVQFFMQPTGGFSHFVMEADIHVRLEVTSPSGLVAKRSFFVKGNLGIGGTAGAAAQQSITDATNRVVKNMVAALLSLGNQHPEFVAARVEEVP
jgi:hypothetical protein